MTNQLNSRISLDELVFENRNKKYGAYLLRRNYARHLLGAWMISITIFGGAFLLAEILDKVKVTVPEIFKPPVEGPLYPPTKVLPDQSTLPKSGPSSDKETAPIIAADFDKDSVVDDSQNLNGPEGLPSDTGQGLAQGDGKHIKEKGSQNQGGDSISGSKYIPPAEVYPEYPGGQKALEKFLTKNLKYPSLAQYIGIEGKVYIGFNVNEKGKISDIKIIRDIGGGCGEEAVRVVKLMPDWKPGTQNGIPVKVDYYLPVEFELH